MSDEFSLHTNFQRASDDPRAQGEYESRMERVRERESEREGVKPEETYSVAFRDTRGDA